MTESAKPEGAGIWSYFKHAFLYRWNVLLVLGASAAALLSPAPDVVLPLIGAAELAYLVGLSSIPRYRAAIDAKVYAEQKGAGTTSAPVQRSLQELVAGLEPAARQRFERLRGRCVEMQRLARGVAGSAASSSNTADELRAPGLDRLLWSFLRLLYSQQALSRFLSATSESEMRKRLEELKSRNQAAAERKDERITRALTDSIATAELRLDNYEKAKSNAEFVTIELDRIEGKIQALVEMAVSHQDPDFISNQVDSVAASMAHTEQAMRELSQITGLTEELDGAPQILNADLSRMR